MSLCPGHQDAPPPPPHQGFTQVAPGRCSLRKTPQPACGMHTHLPGCARAAAPPGPRKSRPSAAGPPPARPPAATAVRRGGLGVGSCEAEEGPAEQCQGKARSGSTPAASRARPSCRHAGDTQRQPTAVAAATHLHKGDNLRHCLGALWVIHPCVIGSQDPVAGTAAAGVEQGNLGSCQGDDAARPSCRY